ncbi:hypothetical protein NP493_37g04026 [Ridgeia piscesae]|uniref:Uncharacterized protein n=1 Tax=Ridgeia piscesae TaxID=27915 RepID=A0AAD9UJS5_RIDPI|nr:hypothetical protein NP493_37g04026 [Ridgeia piscesae]
MNHFAKCCNSKTVSVRTEKAHLVKNSRNECNYSSDESTNCVTKHDRKMIVTATEANSKVKKPGVSAGYCGNMQHADMPRFCQDGQTATDRVDTSNNDV